MFLRTIKWPLIGAVISGGLHFAEVAAWPQLQAVYTPTVLGPVQLAFGIVVGWLAVRNGGNFLTACLYGAALGLFPLMAYPLTFGMLLGQNAAALAGVFGFSMMLFGALVSGALAAGMIESRS